VIFHPGHNPHDAILIFRQQPYNPSTSQNVQFWHLPGRCDSRHQQFWERSGSAWSAQLTALVQRQGKCQVVLIQRQEKWPVTPANYSCTVSKNTMLAGSGIVRLRGGAAPPQETRMW